MKTVLEKFHNSKRDYLKRFLRIIRKVIYSKPTYTLNWYFVCLQGGGFECNLRLTVLHLLKGPKYTERALKRRNFAVNNRFRINQLLFSQFNTG